MQTGVPKHAIQFSLDLLGMLLVDFSAIARLETIYSNKRFIKFYEK